MMEVDRLRAVKKKLTEEIEALQRMIKKGEMIEARAFEYYKKCWTNSPTIHLAIVNSSLGLTPIVY